MPDAFGSRIAYGAVYFRKSNPPKEDWERDYRTATEDGHTVFRHWFLWSAIEVAPDVFDWEEYDRQLDLAASNGIKTVIAEMITAAPEWAFRKYAHARLERQDGSKINSQMSGSCATGGFPGLCLDNDDYRERAGHFLRELATRYKAHPGLGGYDIWNECNVQAGTCYCSASGDRFRAWLRDKYDDDLKALAHRWYRHSLASWADVQPPRNLGPYPDTLDWLEFRIDNAYHWMRWRAEIIAAADADHPVTAHGIAGSLNRMATGCADDWRAAREVKVYGFTWVASRQGDQPWKHWHAVDLSRAASRGKPFWHAEAQAGPLWMQPQVLNRPRDDGRITLPEDLRLWNMITLAGGATGVLSPRWRPLLDGPLFGAFGAYGMDGLRTDRSKMASRVAKWANAAEQRDLWRSRPVKGEIGIVVVPETQLFIYAQQGDPDLYTSSLRGAYQGFFANNIQADWVNIDDIDEYDLLYLPIPVMLKEATVERLREWVQNGGQLVSEGCPAYFGDGGRVGTRQPNFNLAEMFGARETYVEFTPDLLDDLVFQVDGEQIAGGAFLQAYELAGGIPVGHYGDGKIAAVDHTYGKGRTRLIGTFPGTGYHRQGGSSSFFRHILTWAGKEPYVTSSDSRVTARLHSGDGGTYLWVINQTRNTLQSRLALSDEWQISTANALWAEGTFSVDGHTLDVSVPGRDALVIQLSGD